MIGSKDNPLRLKKIDASRTMFTDIEAQGVLDDVSSGRYWQVQVMCYSQTLADCVRMRIFRLAMADGRQFEMTILGSGAAVGVKMALKAMRADKDGNILPRQA